MKKRIKILYVETYTHVAGGQKGLLEIVEYLDKEIFEPIVLIQGEGNLSKGLTDRGVEYIVKKIEPFRNQWFPFSWMLGVNPVKKIIKKVKPDIVHSNHLYVGRYSGRAAKALGIPSIVTLRLVHEPVIYNKYNIDNTLRVHDQIVANSYAGSEVFKSVDGIQHKLGTIQNGMDLEKFRPLENKNDIKKQNAEKFGFNESDIIITQVASMVPQKGNEVLAQAFINLCEKHSNIHLVFVGGPFGTAFNGPIITEMMEEAGLQNKVSMTNFVWDVTEFLNMSDISVLASLGHEGLPRCLIEAIACGNPVVGTDVGGVNEIIDDGVNGFLVPPDSINDLTEKLDILISNTDKRTAFGNAGLRKAHEQFNIRSMIKKYQDKYHGLLSPKK